MTLFHATPAHRSMCPAKSFPETQREEALSYARRAAEAFGIEYSVYAIHGGRPRLLKRFAAPDGGRHRAARR